MLIWKQERRRRQRRQLIPLSASTLAASAGASASVRMSLACPTACQLAAAASVLGVTSAWTAGPPWLTPFHFPLPCLLPSACISRGGKAPPALQNFWMRWQQWIQRCASASPRPTQRTFRMTCCRWVGAVWCGAVRWIAAVFCGAVAVCHWRCCRLPPQSWQVMPTCLLLPRLPAHPLRRPAGRRLSAQRLQATAHAGAERQQRSAGAHAARVHTRGL